MTLARYYTPPELELDRVADEHKLAGELTLRTGPGSDPTRSNVTLEHHVAGVTYRAHRNMTALELAALLMAEPEVLWRDLLDDLGRELSEEAGR